VLLRAELLGNCRAIHKWGLPTLRLATILILQVAIRTRSDEMNNGEKSASVCLLQEIRRVKAERTHNSRTARDCRFLAMNCILVFSVGSPSITSTSAFDRSAVYDWGGRCTLWRHDPASALNVMLFANLKTPWSHLPPHVLRS
jgi:hypothetical protein